MLSSALGFGTVLALISGFIFLLKFILAPHTALPLVTLGKFPFSVPQAPGTGPGSDTVASVTGSLPLCCMERDLPSHRDAATLCVLV